MVTGDTVAMGDTAEVMVTEGIDVMAMGDDVMDEFKTSKVHNFVFRYLSNILKNIMTKPPHFVLSILRDVCNFYFLLVCRNGTRL